MNGIHWCIQYTRGSRISRAGNHSRLYYMYNVGDHSSEIRGLCLMKWPSKTLQNLPHFWNMKTRRVFLKVVLVLKIEFLMNRAYDDIDQGIH